MFEGVSESTLLKVYDWITNTYYSPDPIWNKYETDERIQAIHALNDMRALFSGVGNNGWWDTDRVYHLEDLRDITSYSMNKVLWENAQLKKYHKKWNEAMEEYWLTDEEFDLNEFRMKNGPKVEKMQGNKDGELYKYTKGLFWNSVEWFLDNYATEKERKEVKVLIKN